jgi:iron complex outermembrane recepter protein
VSRDPVTNQITSIDGTYLNFGDLNVAGIDFDVSYQLDTPIGHFAPAISIANMQKYDAAVTPNAPETDRLSKADIDAWAPRWKGTASLAWSHGSYSASAIGRYVSEYLDYQTPSPTDARLGNFWLFDLSGKYKFAGDRIRYLTGGFVQLSVVNLFDSLPKNSWFNYGSQGYDSTQYDIRGRFISLSVGVDL